MKKDYPPLAELKSEFGKNKTIPSQYEGSILRALSHYPELKETKIEFRLRTDHPVPYGTTPAVMSVLNPLAKRGYVISLLEKAQPPMEHVLFRNLPLEAQVAVIGHELGHVLQFETGKASVLRTIISYATPRTQRELERGADICCIEHGLGFELYTHAKFIRAIKGYLEERKEIDVNYLHPNEILETLPPEQLSGIRDQAL
jgi:hypothetical protein